MKSKTSATLVIVLTFFLGGIAGAAGYYLVNRQIMASSPRPPERSTPHNIVEELAQGLSLNSQQKSQLKGIIDSGRDRYRALSSQMRPQYDAIRDQTRQEIRQILTEEQKSRFAKIVKDIDERHKGHEHRVPK